MHKLNQPQTTEEQQTRDAAIQINDEGQSKAKYLRLGLEKDIHHGDWNLSHERISQMAYGYLSRVCEKLTDQNRDIREAAKKDIRRLVKLGKGE